MFDKWRMIWDLMRGQRWRYGGAIAALVLGTMFSYLVPLVCQILLDSVIAGQAMKAPAPILALVDLVGGQSVLARNLWIGGIALVLLTALSGTFGYMRGRWSAVAAESIAQRTRDRLYDHLQHLPCSFFAKRETGDLVQRCTSDVETIRTFLSSQVVEIGRSVIMLLTVIPIMLWLDVRMALLSMAVIVPIIAFAIIFFLRVKAAFKAEDEAEGKMTAQLQENLTGIRVVRAFARQEFECQKFAEKNADHRDKTFRLIYLLAWYWSLSDLMCMAQNGLVLIAGAYWLQRGEITAGTLFVFITYVNMFLWPVRQMGRVLTDLGKTQVSLGRLQEIFSETREDSSADAVAPDQPKPSVNGEIVFENVSFSYGKERPVLQSVSFAVQPGQTLAILGPSGSGKSTLMHLLLRLYDRDAGSIRVDGVDIQTLDRRQVRQFCGVVMQEPFLFSKNVRENIKLGRGAARDEEMIEAAQIANVHDAITGFEKGYDTVVGERGVTLSGGQRQRVALARAILKDAPILILDDALSAVDTKTESLILDALCARHGRRTTLVIAHRLSTLMRADRIIVLDKGQIVQSGTHSSLLQQDGIYRRLWQIQSVLEDDLKRELRLEPQGSSTDARSAAQTINR